MQKSLSEKFDNFQKQYWVVYSFFLIKFFNLLKGYIPLILTYVIFSYVYLSIYSNKGFEQTIILLIIALIISLLRLGDRFASR